VPFALHSDVIVKSLGKTGRVVEAGRDGRYRVRIGGVVMLCREDDLAGAGVDRPAKRDKRGQATAQGRRVEAPPGESPPASESDRRLASLDLHGCTVEEALGEVERRIDLALRAGLDRIELIHGRSSGRIKVAVHRLLRELSAVREFEVSRDNPGVTRVWF
jgi:DNA mismatch repair protein MutS2